MKKATVFISTAALMAGTACGVYAESGDSATTSFDRSPQRLHAVPAIYADYPATASHIKKNTRKIR